MIRIRRRDNDVPVLNLLVFTVSIRCQQFGVISGERGKSFILDSVVAHEYLKTKYALIYVAFPILQPVDE